MASLHIREPIPTIHLRLDMLFLLHYLHDYTNNTFHLYIVGSPTPKEICDVSRKNGTSGEPQKNLFSCAIYLDRGMFDE